MDPISNVPRNNQLSEIVCPKNVTHLYKINRKNINITTFWQKNLLQNYCKCPWPEASTSISFHLKCYRKSIETVYLPKVCSRLVKPFRQVGLLARKKASLFGKFSFNFYPFVKILLAQDLLFLKTAIGNNQTNFSSQKCCWFLQGKYDSFPNKSCSS